MASRGLLAALGGAAKYGLAEDQRRKDEASEERKLRMKLQLEKELWQAKTEYAKANPEYSKFMQDSVTGDTYGIDQFGRSALVRKASEAETAKLARDEELNTRYKNAQIGAAEAQAAAAVENASSNAEYRKMMAEAAKSRAQTYADRPPSTPRPTERDRKTDAELEATAADLAAKKFNVRSQNDLLMLEPEQLSEMKAFEQKVLDDLRRQREAGGAQNHRSTAPMQQPSSGNDFESLIPKDN